MVEKIFDIIVMGAGPAGSTFTAFLRDSGLRIAVVDKAWFPRDKACGDLITVQTLNMLEHLPAYEEYFPSFIQESQPIRGSTLYAPNFKTCQLHFQQPAYCLPRRRFDYLLLQLARKNPDASFFQGDEVKNIRRENGFMEVLLKGGGLLKGRLLVGCDGSNSMVARKLSHRLVKRAHHSAAIRAYYQGLQGASTEMLEIYYLKEYLPGYFWTFPLGNDRWNVGFGMLSDQRVNYNIHLRESFKKIIRGKKGIKEKFKGARRISLISGAGLMLGSRQVAASGAGYLLCGDAASLIDPLTGEGIRNAIKSAELAAQTAQLAFARNDLSQKMLASYDQQLDRTLRKELNQKYRLQKMLRERPSWINFLIGQLAHEGFMSKWIKKFIRPLQ